MDEMCGWMKCVDEIFGCVWMRMDEKCGCNYKTKLHYGFLSDKLGLRARVRNCTSFSEQNEMQCRKMVHAKSNTAKKVGETNVYG